MTNPTGSPRPDQDVASTATVAPDRVVRGLFEAFGRGDVDGILEFVHPETRWWYVGANPDPRRGVIEGHAGVRRFFEGILKRLDMRSYEPREWFVQGDTVVIFGSESGVVRKSGKPFHNDWVQKYVVEDGRITAMEEFNIVDPERAASVGTAPSSDAAEAAEAAPEAAPEGTASSADRPSPLDLRP